MEKDDTSRKLKIAITGPESTGKTELALKLASYFHSSATQEYARGYVERLNRDYNYLDVLHIAGKQVEELSESANSPVFFDTELIITKIWLEVVYGHCPEWIDIAINESEIDLYLLCGTDIPWIKDEVRENGGEMREKLFHIYQQELKSRGVEYRIVDGMGDSRLENAIKQITEYLEKGHLRLQKR